MRKKRKGGEHRAKSRKKTKGKKEKAEEGRAEVISGTRDGRESKRLKEEKSA